MVYAKSGNDRDQFSIGCRGVFRHRKDGERQKERQKLLRM